MSLKGYERYRESGVEWLGEVPEHWKVASLRHVSKRYSGGTPDKQNLSFWENGTIPWLNSGSVNQVQISEPSELITEEAYDNSSAKWIPKEALVMALAGQGKTKGMVAQLKISATCNQSMAAIIPYSSLNSRFLFWYLHANYENIRNLASGDDRDGLNLDLLGSIKCPMFAFKEQIAIATFLDRETAKIDSLIAEQQRFIELLKEKRQVLISHAVTKGLDPNAPMKDSGVEWLGEVPEHWDVLQIKRLSPVLRGASPRPIDDPKYFDEDGEFAWVRISDVSACDGKLKDTTQKLSILGSSLSIKIYPGQLFVSIAGTVGKPCISEINACIHDGFVYFSKLNNIQSRFIYKIFESGNCFGGLGKLGTQLNLNTDTIGSIQIGCPPVNEMISILSHLDRETAKIDALIAESDRAISLLQEKRTSLISAAVTGKIDVRHLAPREES